ncbi:deleted in azoospermia-like [Hyla sarda]|uniref:deleted in azoospermia-like n=1 Tax=Hyla sarda TaxID=327740 RepID=UPI0024C2D6BB|nr:deleted in azoospermia-like [Hyla sarda]
MSASGSLREEDPQTCQGYVLPEGRIVPNTIFIGGVDTRMDEFEIKEFFSKYGAVKEVKIITDRTGVSKGYGFVSFYDDVDVQKIVDSQISFHGKRLKLGPAIRKYSSCTYIQPRHVVIRSPAPQYPNMWNPPLSDPYVQNAPVLSPMTQYMQTCPYPSSTPVVYHQIPYGCHQPGYYQVPQQWPHGDQRSFVCPQTLTWNGFNDTEMASNEFVPPEAYNQEQNVSPVSTSPRKKVDRSIQTILSCLLNGDGRLQRSIVSQDDYFKERRVHQFRRSRPVFKPNIDKSEV